VGWHAGPSATHAEVTREDTGEIFAAVPLALWARLVALAAACDPCVPGCGTTACRLATAIAEAELARGDSEA
jgi:hypothetical protein